VHCHPGKVNVVAGVLSSKAHYNCLLVVSLTREESSTRVLPDLSLFNIILTPSSWLGAPQGSMFNRLKLPVHDRLCPSQSGPEKKIDQKADQLDRPGEPVRSIE
jgi:hypothetical protein